MEGSGDGTLQLEDINVLTMFLLQLKHAHTCPLSFHDTKSKPLRPSPTDVRLKVILPKFTTVWQKALAAAYAWELGTRTITACTHASQRQSTRSSWRPEPVKMPATSWTCALTGGELPTRHRPTIFGYDGTWAACSAQESRGALLVAAPTACAIHLLRASLTGCAYN